MNPFPSALYRQALRQRCVVLVPLIEITLPSDANGSTVPTGYMSDRNITIGSQLYQRRLIDWSGIKFQQGNAAASGGTQTQTATFTLSNVDRVLESAARAHAFYRGILAFKVHAPWVLANGGSVSDSIYKYWQGFIASFKLNEDKMELTVKDGYFGLTRPSPRRRLGRDCDNMFDDGLRCPYSGYEHKGAGTGSIVPISDLTGIVAETPFDFDQNLQSGEGYHAFPGFTSCDKSFTACKLRGMARFFGGMRYVSSWAGVHADDNPYASYSSPNDSVFNAALLRVYGEGRFVLSPPLFQYRPEKQYTAAECIISAGPIGSSVDGISNSTTIGYIYLNGVGPHAGQFPTTAGFGVSRSAGRIGETLQWEQIGGDLRQSNAPGDPPIYFNGIAGAFIRSQIQDSGINNPQVTNTSYSPQGAPSVQLELISGGLSVWNYFDPTTRSRHPSDNASWTVLDIVLDALDLTYSSPAVHGTIADLQSFCDHSAFCEETVTDLVTGSLSFRYQSRGVFAETRPALDNIDAALKDCSSYRVWRQGKIVIAPFAGGHLDNTVRPGFQEFVNVVDGSLDTESIEPTANEYRMNFSDQDFDFAKNTATVYSESFQRFSGLLGHRDILSQSISLTTTFTTDQATRLGAIQLRYDIGGTVQSQWQHLRKGTHASTFMMAECEPGDITHIAHTMVPGGGSWIRLEGVELQKDWKLKFDWRTFRISDYDDTAIGASTCEPPEFSWSPFIPGSGGLGLAALPALTWRFPTTPIPNTPGTGALLQWSPYGDDHDNSLFKVQIYKTTSPFLSGGGYLVLDTTKTSTTWQVGTDEYDFVVGHSYLVDNETVTCTGAPGGGVITVTRHTFGSTASIHKKLTQIRPVPLLDQVPSPTVPQSNLPDQNSYLDPWTGLS